MKNIIKSLLTLMMVTAVSFSYAQPKGTAESAAKSVLNKWKTELNLTDEQSQQLYESALAMQAVQRDPAATKEDKKAAQKKHSNNVNKILTPEQLQKKNEIDKAAAAAKKAKQQ